MAIDGLIAELSGLGVVLRIEGDRLAFDAPAGVITGDLLGRMKADRDGLLTALAGVPVDSVAAEPVADAIPEPVIATSIRCPFCGEIDLTDDPDGLRCGSCEALAWVITAEGGLVRRDVAEIELVDPDLVPVCPSCGRWADVMTAAKSWHCSRCDPKADERRRRTVRVLAFASRGRLRSVGCDGRPNKKTAYRREMPGCMIAFDDPVPGVPCERCRSVMSHLIPVHAGMSLRRDCSGCGRFVENPVWYDAAAARDLLAGLKT